jgi:hypothetical protein
VAFITLGSTEFAGEPLDGSLHHSEVHVLMCRCSLGMIMANVRHLRQQEVQVWMTYPRCVMIGASRFFSPDIIRRVDDAPAPASKGVGSNSMREKVTMVTFKAVGMQEL